MCTQRIAVEEIFQGIDGEVTSYGQGAITTFIRFAGCNLRCSYCDTKWAQEVGEGKEGMLRPLEIVYRIHCTGGKKVTITGGEPLLQRVGFSLLVASLKYYGYWISVETNGSLPVCPADDPVDCWVVDYKLRSSGMMMKMDSRAFQQLRSCDFVKFVIMDIQDYEKMKGVMSYLQASGCKARFAVGVVGGGKAGKRQMSVKALLERLLADGIRDVIINVQIHKLIGLR